ncbi:OmpA family protein, partial [Bacteroides thetaiotaomicron]
MTLANNMYLCVVNLLKYYFINLFKKHCIMNKMKWMVLFMSITMIFSGCASMNNTGKGAAIGGGSGAALGAILGGVIGKGKG